MLSTTAMEEAPRTNDPGAAIPKGIDRRRIGTPGLYHMPRDFVCQARHENLRRIGQINREQIIFREEIMENGAHRSRHSASGTFGATHTVVAITAAESAEKNPRHGDDAAVRAGSIGIGLTEGGPFILGGARSAELLQLFIENL